MKSKSEPRQASVDALERELRERTATLARRHNVPGVGIGGQLGAASFFVDYGVTQVDHPLPVDRHTLFQIASNTKPFTATLVMQLVEDGAVQLHAPPPQLPARASPARSSLRPATAGIRV